MEYEPKLTPLAVGTVLDALTTAWRKALSQEPCRDSVVLLAAHSALETARWRRMPNYNYAGIKAFGSQDFATWTTHEGDAHPVTIQGRFRAYPDKDVGAEEFIRFLAKMGRYVKAWTVLSGTASAADYGRLLKAAGYYTGNEAAYCAGLQREWDWIAPQALGYAPGIDGVRQLQAAHPPLVADGIFGPRTRAAVKQLLRDVR